MSTVFFSYSHKDEALRDRLEVHLAALRRDGSIATWHDRRIVPGDELAHQIDENLNQADIILLLISPDFLASDYCHDVEMERALERNAGGSARVIPVILRPCDWKNSSFAHLLALPTDGVPITRWPDEDEAFLNVVEGIRAALPATRKPRPTPHGLIPEAGGKTSVSTERSSNLRLRKTFSDVDRDRFLEESFEFIGRYFENSLRELGDRNEGVEGRFRRIDAVQFSAIIYENGRARAQCTVRLGGMIGSGITYSTEVGGSGNSWNEMLSVEHDEQHQFFRSMGLLGRERNLSQEGAAEHLWSMLIAPLQG